MSDLAKWLAALGPGSPREAILVFFPLISSAVAAVFAVRALRRTPLRGSLHAALGALAYLTVYATAWKAVMSVSAPFATTCSSCTLMTPGVVSLVRLLAFGPATLIVGLLLCWATERRWLRSSFFHRVESVRGLKSTHLLLRR